MHPTSLLLLVLAYLWGSLSPAFFVAYRFAGIDLRQYGSGNVGSSNVGEQLGRVWTAGVGFLDLVKGFVPAMLARAFGFDLQTIALVGIATVVGHNWSLYLRFRGGRGIAATIGVLFAWDVRLALSLLVLFALSVWLKQSAPGALIGMLLLAPGAWWLGDAPEIVLACAALAVLVVLKRLEANGLPLPRGARARSAVLLRRIWQDRDVPPNQPWEERRRIQ
jgi:glycerol-3-phosphate acyltransferase PlsY